MFESLRNADRLTSRPSLHLARVMPNGLCGGERLIPLTPHDFSVANPQTHFEAIGVIPFSSHVSYRSLHLRGQYLNDDACLLHHSPKVIVARQKCLCASCGDPRLENRWTNFKSWSRITLNHRTYHKPFFMIVLVILLL